MLGLKENVDHQRTYFPHYFLPKNEVKVEGTVELPKIYTISLLFLLLTVFLKTFPKHKTRGKITTRKFFKKSRNFSKTFLVRTIKKRNQRYLHRFVYILAKKIIHGSIKRQWTIEYRNYSTEKLPVKDTEQCCRVFSHRLH